MSQCKNIIGENNINIINAIIENIPNNNIAKDTKSETIPKNKPPKKHLNRRLDTDSHIFKNCLIFFI